MQPSIIWLICGVIFIMFPCCMPGIIEGVCGDGAWPCWAYTADSKAIPSGTVAPGMRVLSTRAIGWSFPDLREIGLAYGPGDAYDQDHATPTKYENAVLPNCSAFLKIGVAWWDTKSQ